MSDDPGITDLVTANEPAIAEAPTAARRRIVPTGVFDGTRTKTDQSPRRSTLKRATRTEPSQIVPVFRAGIPEPVKERTEPTAAPAGVAVNVAGEDAAELTCAAASTPAEATITTHTNPGDIARERAHHSTTARRKRHTTPARNLNDCPL